MGVTATWTNPTNSPPDLITGQGLSQAAWEDVLSNLYYLGGANGSGGTVGSVPSGSMSAYGAGTTDPTGWFLCDGRAVSRTTYSALFTAIGTAYGSGDGSTTFNIPDLRGRTIFGADNMGTGQGAASRFTANNTLGATAQGEYTHTLTSGESGVAVHAHTASGHVHTITCTESNTGSASTWYPEATDATGGQTLTSVPQTNNAADTINNATGASAGSGHNTIPLCQIANWIIKQ